MATEPESHDIVKFVNAFYDWLYSPVDIFTTMPKEAFVQIIYQKPANMRFPSLLMQVGIPHANQSNDFEFDEFIYARN